MNIRMPELSDLKKIVNDAGRTFSHVVQLTEEKFGAAEKTDLSPRLANLCTRAEVTKHWSEKMLRNVEAVTTPNPGNRMEDYLLEKIEKKKPTRLTNLEHLGIDMMQAGADLDGAYAHTLTKVGQAEQKLGAAERNMICSSFTNYISPMRRLIDEDMKRFTQEKNTLESLRLDLDAAKGRVRKAREMLGQKEAINGGPTPQAAFEQAERDLQRVQADFDQQAVELQTQLETIGTIHKAQLRQLHSFVQAQSLYFREGAEVMEQLQADLVQLGGDIPYGRVGSVAIVVERDYDVDDETVEQVKAATRKRNASRARVLCAYDAIDATELDLTVNEIIIVQECTPPHPDYMFCDQPGRKGLVPRAFLELIVTDGN